MGRQGPLLKTEIERTSRHTDSQEAHEKMLSIPIREIQIKSTRYHLTLVRKTIIKTYTKIKELERKKKSKSVHVQYPNCYTGQPYSL